MNVEWTIRNMDKSICQEKYMDKKRIEYVDIFRGIGIILMILGHIGYIGIFDKIIRHVGFNVSADIVVHAFHMPMFFVVSGFFYSRPVKLCGGGVY